MKNLTTKTILTLIAFLPNSSFGRSQLDAPPPENDAKEAFFNHSKIDTSATPAILWSIITDERFTNENGGYQGTQACQEDGKMILKLDSLEDQNFAQNIMKCNPAQYQRLGSGALPLKTTCVDQSAKEVNKEKCEKVFRLHLLGALYRKEQDDNKRMKIKACIEKNTDCDEFYSGFGAYLVKAQKERVEKELEEANGVKAAAIEQVQATSSSVMGIFTGIFSSSQSAPSNSPQTQQLEQKKMEQKKTSLQHELKIIEFISKFHFSSSFQASPECKVLAEETIKLIPYVTEDKDKRELYKRAFIYANSDNKAGDKKARKTGKKLIMMTEKYPEDLFEVKKIELKECPNENTLFNKKNVMCEPNSTSMELSSAVLTNGKRNTCVNGMKPKKIKRHFVKRHFEKTPQWGNFSPDDLKIFDH